MKLYLLLITVIFTQPCLSLAQWNSLDQYYQSLQSGCNSDADCLVKNVGNCCGMQPKCVGKESNPDPGWVTKFCEEQGIVAICGHLQITGCRCEESKCRDEIATHGGVEVPVPIM